MNQVESYNNTGGVTIDDSVPESAIQRSGTAHAVEDGHAQSLLIPVDHAISAAAIDPHQHDVILRFKVILVNAGDQLVRVTICKYLQNVMSNLSMPKNLNEQRFSSQIVTGVLE